ncbi:MAG: hypothetical protein IK117_03945 [Bacteroidales bacterium]|nr:hypothetical protein [Bacteroidales bacterium]
MRRFFLFFNVLLLANFIFAQAPQKMNFQALIRNSNNELVKNQTISVQVSVMNASNTAVYSEQQTVTTNANGVATMVIGEGTPTVGTFSAIDWSVGSYFLQTTVDFGDGTSSVSGVSPLLSVPYALYAEKAGVADMSKYYTKAQIDDLLENLNDAFQSISEAMLTISDAVVALGNEVNINGGFHEEGTPILSETVASDITASAFTVTSAIRNNGGYPILESGFCIGLEANPTIESTRAISTETSGAFSGDFVGLNSNTTYYVRSYAITEQGVGYGCETQVTTKSLANYTYPTGSVENGYFSVANNKKVVFSMGNLQYVPMTGIWKFASNQYTAVGLGNNQISENSMFSMDLFGWGASGWEGGVNAYDPANVSTDEEDYWVGGNYFNDLTGRFANADWGVHNAIQNGGNQVGLWRTLEYEEWEYLIKERLYADKLQGSGTIDGVHGIILLPDNWTQPADVQFIAGLNGFDSNVYSTEEWTKMEENGAVFLPAAGLRLSTTVVSVGELGMYWSSTCDGLDIDRFVFTEEGVVVDALLEIDDLTRAFASAVRLVQDLK